MADYKLSLRSALVGEERERALSECHQRGADRLLQLCFANGGVYTKLGQHVGQLDHLLPEEYVVTMRNNLLDRCPVSTIGEVRRTIQADLGAPPEQLFARFDPNPIASASLAQVHVAEDADGRVLAVKVQHAGLRESAAADMWTVEALVHAARLVFPAFDYQWLVDEIKYNLPRELDFAHEAANAERCRANLNGPRSTVAGRVHIPHIDHSRTSQRVLTMEFIQGVPVTDPAGLRALGVSPGALSRLISETFNEMVFRHGDVHADPHTANLLVRKQNGRMQLVLLDHGLYKRIDDTFRLQYAGLWHALVFGDVEGIKRHSEAMNAGDMYPLFAAMLTQKPWEQIEGSSGHPDHLVVPRTREHRQLVQDYAQQYMAQISTMLCRMPRDLLLLLKTNDCLRAVDASLGQPISNFVVIAREATRALEEERLSHATRGRVWLTQALVALHMARLEVRMAVFRALVWLASWRDALAWRAS